MAWCPRSFNRGTFGRECNKISPAGVKLLCFWEDKVCKVGVHKLEGDNRSLISLALLLYRLLLGEGGFDLSARDTGYCEFQPFVRWFTIFLSLDFHNIPILKWGV